MLEFAVILLLSFYANAEQPDQTKLDKADWNDHNIVLVNGNWVHAYVPQASDPKPFKPFDNKWKDNTSSIVFLIAALRETRCPDTLHHLFTHAAHPNRVYAGWCS